MKHDITFIMHQSIRSLRMKKVKIFLTFVLFSPFYLFSQPDTWVQKKDIGYYLTAGPQATSLGIGLSIGSKGYVFTSDDDMQNSDFWEYDPVTNLWSQRADFPGTRRTGAIAFGVGSKGYYGTGFNGSSYMSDFWEYDPATNAWTAKASFPGASRKDALGLSIGTKGYITLGENAGGLLVDLWEYTPSTNSWLQRLNFPSTSRRYASGTGIGLKGYVGLGLNNLGTELADFWEYTPLTNTWLVRTSFPGAARGDAISFSIGSKGYFGCGMSSLTRFVDFYEYNPSTNAWIAKASFIGATSSNPVAFSIGTDGFVGLGNTTGDVGDFWKYNSVTNAWSSISRFGAINRMFAAGFSINEKIYMGTGQSNDKFLNDLWEWDPALEVWTQKANLPGVARYGASGFAIGSKGYMGMGTGASSVLSDFYEYNPTTNTWTTKANFGGGLRSKMASFVIGNKAYVGTGANSTAFTSGSVDFWEYDPALNTWLQKANFGGSVRSEAISFTIGNKGYVGGGLSSGSATSDFWEYNPTTNSWTQKANLGGGNVRLASGFSLGSIGYLAGGDNLSLYNQLYKYNPFTNVWTKLNDLPGDRYEGTAISNSTKAYFGGGSNGSRLLNDFWEYQPENQINLTALSGSSYCKGDSMHVSFTVLYPFDAGNIFTAQLSDQSGSFSSPLTLGSISSTTSGTISFVLPTSISVGSEYRVRIVSSLPAIASNDNGSNLTIQRFEQIIFTEQMGIVGATTPVSTHESTNGFDNDSYTMTGTADVRVTVPSSGYLGASGDANIFFNSISGRFFQIEGINTIGLSGFELRFGIYKNTILSVADQLILEISSDGVNYSPLSYTLPTGTGTAAWFLRTASGTIPSVSNLRIRFRQAAAIPITQYRIDDIQLTSNNPGAVITAVLPNYICNGSSVALNASTGIAYQWSNGATTTSTNVNTVGPHSCTIMSSNGCTSLSNTILLKDTTPALFSVTGGGAYCSFPGTGVSVGLSGSETGTSYQLYLNGITPSGLPVNGNGSAISFGLKTIVGTYSVIATETSTGCSKSMGGIVTVLINNATTYYEDADGDGYGNVLVTAQACSPPVGYVANQLDCNDADTLLHPNQVWYIDADEDDYGTGATVVQCLRPNHGYRPTELTAITGDCDDANAAIHPGVTEICNNLDDNCDGYIDEGCGIPIYCIGPGSSYTPPSGPSYVNQFSPFPTIKAAVNFLNTWSPTQSVIFEIQNNYTGAGETFPITFTYQGNASATAVFRPRSDVPAVVGLAGISPGSNNGMFILDGADYVTFDGSPGGIMGTNPMFRIRNLFSSGVAGANILLRNDATHNTFNALLVEGGANSGGCIFLSYTIGTTGNDFNSILNCTISDRTDLSVPEPDIAIYCYSIYTGSAANSDIVISGNKIVNISDGIILDNTGSAGNWNISNNHFYFTNSSAFKISEAISVKTNDPLSATISSNYIGGTAPFAGGSPMIETSPNLSFNGIYFSVSNATSKSFIDGNVIKNYQRNSTGVCSFQGINVAAGAVDVTNNMIGDPSISNSLDFLSAAEPFIQALIHISAQNLFPVSVSGNTIGGISASNTTGTSGEFQAINYSNVYLSSFPCTIGGNTIRSVNYAARGAFSCIDVTCSESTGMNTSVNGNVIESIVMGNSLAGAFTGIYSDRANVSFTGNRIGKFSTPNDISIASTGNHYGMRISRFSNGNGVFANDTIANINFMNNSASNAVFGFYLTTNGSSQNEVSGNYLKNITCASTKSSVETDASLAHALTGIYYNVEGSAGLSVSNNIIEGLSATTTSTISNPLVSAISINRPSGSGTLTVSGNRIYSLTNTGANTSSLSCIIGLRMYSSQYYAVVVSNNFIALSNDANTNPVRIYGIYDSMINGFIGNYKNYFFNSIAISGSATGDSRSGAFWHNSSTALLKLRNNILHNTRSGGTGNHYAIVHEGGTSVSWAAGSSDYNDLYTSNSATLGAWPLATALTFSGWKSASNGDNLSKNSLVSFVNSISDLHLNLTGNCDLEGGGIPVSGTTLDIDGQTRNSLNPDIGADEFNGTCIIVLNLKTFIEGFYSGGGTMISALSPGSPSVNCDTLILQLAASTSPYSIQYTDTAILQTNGTVEFNFPSAVAGGTYYLVLKHRNALTVWSAVAILVNNGSYYDFSTAASQAFGSNQRFLDTGIYGMYSGDVNQDGTVDTIDYSAIESNSQFMLSGYVPSDISGDWLVESTDYSLIENNFQMLLNSAHP